MCFYSWCIGNGWKDSYVFKCLREFKNDLNVINNHLLISPTNFLDETLGKDVQNFLNEYMDLIAD